jgi:hypothetical protein
MQLCPQSCTAGPINTLPSRLREVNLRDNKLTGPLILSDNKRTLEVLDLQGNKISGEARCFDAMMATRDFSRGMWGWMQCIYWPSLSPTLHI